ncbi:MAG TPA: SMC-Scp complex subunit ScpB [Eubacteriaceae bacterium]|nr:SMC-Scp complex subunit ScpB [Eubacteriaceae bacterium]
MNVEEKKTVVESLLFAFGEPVSLRDLAAVLQVEEKEAKEIALSLVEEYQRKDRGIWIKQLDRHFQITTNPRVHSVIKEFLEEKNKSTLSQAAMETLAIVAYKQPVTRTEIEQLRGVKSSSAVQTLIDRGLVKERGVLDAPGKPKLFVTTVEFLKMANITQLSELPDYEAFVNGIQEKMKEDETIE